MSFWRNRKGWDRLIAAALRFAPVFRKVLIQRAARAFPREPCTFRVFINDVEFIVPAMFEPRRGIDVHAEVCPVSAPQDIPVPTGRTRLHRYQYS